MLVKTVGEDEKKMKKVVDEARLTAYRAYCMTVWVGTVPVARLASRMSRVFVSHTL